jgi:hypothetical protein
MHKKEEIKVLKKGAFLRRCSFFGESRDFIEKKCANFVDSILRVGV